MKYFAKLLRLRNSMKSLQQISWTISQFEKRYNPDDVDDELAKELVEAYLEYIPQLKRLLDELEAENGKSPN
jgi:uncharacterized protein Yka (UPF0111/DUF47 family)